MCFINKLFDILLLPLKLVILGIIYFYKKVISPAYPASCRYTPSCSSYMLIAIKKHGLIRGFFIGIKRISRCNANASGGYDPVKENIKGDAKWII